MTDQTPDSDIADGLAALLPQLRRYTRSLTGSQASGDAMAIATFEAILADRGLIRAASSIQTGLFAVCHTVWTDQGAQAGLLEDPAFARAQEQLNTLTPLSREALLLSAVEEFTVTEIAEILSVSEDETDALLAAALSEIKIAGAGRIMVIEDEAVIAMDLRDILKKMGHDVIGAASTHQEAIDIVNGVKPDLILSDIKLADGSLGTEAVADILRGVGETPVIFITAYPELLLTGERPEPAFVIPKPYQAHKVISAVSQAMFFATTDAIAL